MKTMKKILLAAALILIGCLAGTKVVKADATMLTLYYAEGSKVLNYSFDDEPTNVTEFILESDEDTYEITPIRESGTVSAAVLLDITGTGTKAGKSYTVTATVTTDPEDPGVSVSPATVKVYSPNLTASHGTFEAADPAYGLKGQTYSSAWVSGDDGYFFVEWDDGITDTDRDDLEFGTEYTVITEEITVASISTTELSGLDPTADQDVKITLSSASADTSLLTYATDSFTESCSADWDGDYSDTVTFSNVTGNGSFTLVISYDGTEIATQKMTVRSTVTDIVSDSYTIRADDSKSFTVKTVPEGGVVECVTTKTPAGVDEWAWDFSGTEGTLDITTTEKASGNITFKFQSGSVKKDITIKVIKEEDVDYVEVTGPNQVTKNGTATYKATVWLKDGSKSKQGVNWQVDSPSTIKKDANGNGVLTAKGNVGDTIRVTAKAIADEEQSFDYVDVKVVSTIKTGDLIFKSADDSGTIKITKANDSSSDYKLDLSWGKGVTGQNPNASVSKITYALAYGDKDAGSFSGSTFTPKKTGLSATYTPTVHYTDGTTEVKDDITIEVIEDWISNISASSSSSSSSSDYYISFKKEENEIYSGSDPAKNLVEITGYTVEVLRNGSVLASKTVTPSDFSSGNTYKVDKDTINELLKEVKADGDSFEGEFRILPYGKSQNGSSTKVTDSTATAVKTVKKTVYKDGDHYSLDKGSSSSSMKSSSGLPSGSGSDYDKVPKTGEGNTRLLIIMIAVISATIAGSILLSNLPVRSKSGADESVDDKDVFHKKD